MLGKLLKQEFKATSRLILPLCGATVVMAIVNRITAGGNMSNMDGMSARGIMTAFGFMIYIFLLMAVFITITIITIYRFYKNLMTEEGYLMFTLPAPAWQHVAAKGITAVAWQIGGVLVTILSFTIMTFTSDIWKMLVRDLGTSWEYVYQYTGIRAGWWIAGICLSILIMMVFSILMTYASIAVGHLWKEHRIIGAICAYIVISIVISILSGVLMGTVAVNLYNNAQALQDPTGLITGMLALIFGGMLVLSAAFFVGTNLILSRKLNLE